MDHHKVNTLTVHDVGLIVFNETQPFSDNPDANDSIDSAREKIAHTVINADNKFGAQRNHLARTASPIEPSAKALENPQTRAAYDSSMAAAREAYLSPTAPTQSAAHFNFRTSPDRSNLKFKGGALEGLPIRTQSGPFRNSYLKGDTPSPQVWVTTYGDN
jgi:hypothetical protein